MTGKKAAMRQETPLRRRRAAGDCPRPCRGLQSGRKKTGTIYAGCAFTWRIPVKTEALEERMALVEKSHGGYAKFFPFSPSIGPSRWILKALGFLVAFNLPFFALGFAFSHGYWVIAWSAAAALAWLFMFGASEASLPSER